MGNQLSGERKAQSIGMFAAVFCAAWWGVMPIYWQSLIPINSYVIILYRIVLVGITCFLAALKVYGIEGIKAPVRQKGILLKLFCTGIIITLNWSIYIYAVNSGQTIATCIGYYIDPLMICVFGIIFFKERPTKYKMISIGFACAGVLIVMIHFMKLPLIALSIATTFSVYTALKKHMHLPALVSLFFETVFIAPAALAAIIYLEVNGKGAVAAAEPYQLVLLLFIGLMTAVPLTLFAVAVNRISMISLGITEYLSPSITLLIGIFLFKEAFDLVQLIAFAVIWVGLVFFTYGEIKEKNGQAGL